MSIKILILIIAIQFVALTLLAIAPFGFDHPSEWGLDYNDFLVGVGFYCLALGGGVAASAARKRWWLLALQLAVASVATVMFFWPWISTKGDGGSTSSGRLMRRVCEPT